MEDGSNKVMRNAWRTKIRGRKIGSEILGRERLSNLHCVKIVIGYHLVILSARAPGFVFPYPVRS